jgi:hypothetical protein
MTLRYLELNLAVMRWPRSRRSARKLLGRLTYRPTVSLPALLEKEILQLAMTEYHVWLRARTPAPSERGKLFPAPDQRAAAMRA